MSMRKIANAPGALGTAEDVARQLRVYRSIEQALERGAAVPKVADQLPNGLYAIFLACWAVLVGVFVMVFTGNPEAFFNVGIAFFTGVMFFGLPLVMSRVGKNERPAAPALVSFLRGEFATLTGPISGFEALIQVILVPACLSLGAIAIAYIIHEDYLEVLARVAH
jgi:hypothetical protein